MYVVVKKFITILNEYKTLVLTVSRAESSIVVYKRFKKMLLTIILTEII